MKRIFLLFTFFLQQCFLMSQENNYWNAQYGSNSAMLGGAVVSTYCDNGAMFYNPATMAFKDSGSISFSANLYKLERIVATNALGDGLDLSNFNYAILPQLVSGNFHINKKIELGLILITRNDVDFAFSQSINNTYRMRPTYSEPDSTRPYNYIANFEGHSRIYETWGGLSASYKINDHFSIGLTNFITYRYQKFQRSLNITALGLEDTTYSYNAKFQSTQNVAMYDFNYILKLGAAYTSKRFDAGVSLTLPSLTIFGIGRATTEWYLSNSTPDWDENYLVFDKEIKHPFVYKTPLSVAAGTCFKFNKTKIFLSGEYFASIQPYEVYAPVNDTSYKSKNIIRFTTDTVNGVIKFANPVFNFAIGLEQKLNAKLKLLMGFNSDFSAVNSDNVVDDYNDISYSYMNLWHCSAGFKIASKKKIITIGVSTSWGRLDDQTQYANLTAPTDIEESSMMGYVNETSTYRYKGIALIFGINF
ncbi:MAG: hypothetical protein V4547_11340 [Bacteroidota bacterium]